MTRTTRRNLIVSALVAAGSLAAIPTCWAASVILVDNNPSTSAPTRKSDRVTSGSRWVDFMGAVGTVPTTGGRRGAWADATATSAFNTERHNMTLVWQCTTGGLQQNGPVLFTGTFLSPDLAGVCSGSSTSIAAIITDNLAN